MTQGIIVKAIGGFYYVLSDGVAVECKARGLFRKNGIVPLVGDIAEITPNPGGKGVITGIKQRKNSFIRPAVANIDCLVIVVTAAFPAADTYFIDRITVTAETAGCEIVICINKTDINAGDDLFRIYSSAGYSTIRTCSLTGFGINELKRLTTDKISVLAGNSGVGKSSLMNALDPGFGLVVGEISKKLKRGKHTTRHVELLPAGGQTLIADTPGFESFDFANTEITEKKTLQYAFPEFRRYSGECRFSDCLHKNEPGCAVTDALREGIILPSRYGSYVKMLARALQNS